MTARMNKSLAILLAAGLFSAAAVTNGRLQRHRTVAAAPSGQPLVAASPAAAITTIFLGGFRGLISDMLWVRASILQEQGRYFELVQLADWITALEPSFPQVWALQAWNMAYNISVLMPDDPGRWRWVENGVHLLRDRALPATARSAEVCLELGLLFQHKIGGGSDDHSDYLRQRWVQEIMQNVSRDGLLSGADTTILIETFMMDPLIMQRIEDHYGTQDWRIPEAHALYWAFAGLTMNPDAKTAVLCRRMIYQVMADLFEKGGLTVEPDAGIMILTPAFSLLPGALLAFEEALPSDPTASEGFSNFLRRAIHLYTFFQRREDALPLFDMLHDRFPAADTASGFDHFPSSRQAFMPKIINIR